MHGVTKPITLPVDFLGEQKFMKGAKAGFETAITLNRKDYGLNWNRALESGGVMVGEEVEIAINIEADFRRPQPRTDTRQSRMTVRLYNPADSFPFVSQ